MSTKVQINCSQTNKLWVFILKNKWKSVSRISEQIKELETNKEELQNTLSNFKEEESNYIFQKQKILRLEIMIQLSKKSRNHELEMISSLSTILARTTC